MKIDKTPIGVVPPSPDKDLVAWQKAEDMTIQMNAYYRQANNLDANYKRISTNNYTPPKLSWGIAKEFSYSPTVSNSMSTSSDIFIVGRK